MMTTKSRKITLEYILLGLLKDQPSHGYALYEKLQNSSELALIWKVKRSKFYYFLDKLAGEGLLSVDVRPQDGSPDRKIYQLTENGLQTFNTWLEEPVTLSRFVRISFMAKLFFALQQGTDPALILIQKQLEICQEWLESLRGEAQKVPQGEFISVQVFEFRIGQINAMISWLENCRDQLPR
jgi:DNA-binding PadR family transcriptional regulator